MVSRVLLGCNLFMVVFGCVTEMVVSGSLSILFSLVAICVNCNSQVVVS